MPESLLKPLVETSYLNVQNVGRYRCIMRFFYVQHQRLRYWLKPQEIFDGVVAYGLLGEDYTLEQCQKDLDQLAEWPISCPAAGVDSATVENTQKIRYQMTVCSRNRTSGSGLEKSVVMAVLELPCLKI